MLKLIWLILVAFLVSIAAIWMIDHDGQVMITWFGYEARTSVLAALIITIFFAVIVFAVSYLVARILAIRFPSIMNLFFKKTRLKRLERIVKRNKIGLDMMAKLLMAIETKDVKASGKLQNKLSKLIKNSQLNNFLSGKIAFDNKDYSKAESYFSKLEEDQYSKILVLKAKFYLALGIHDDIAAIAYAKQILSIKIDNPEIVLKLFSLYKKHGLWKETKNLVSQYGFEKFGDELQKRDIAVMNTALAYECYRGQNFSQAVRHSKAALKVDKHFLPATEILLRSWIKRGLSIKASWTIKKLWRDNPHLILAEIFDLIHRKSSAKNRIKAMKKLAALNSRTYLGKLAVGIVAFRVGDFDMAKEYLRLSVLQEKNYRAYKLLSYTERKYGDKDKAQKYAEKANMIRHNDHYSCGNCGHSSSKWSSKCSKCGTHDSLEWNS